MLQALRDTATPVTRIGHIVDGNSVRALDAAGAEWQPPRSGYAHFAG